MSSFSRRGATAALALLLCLLPGSSSPAQAQSGPVAFRVLLIVLRQTHAAWGDVRVDATMDDADVLAVRTAFETYVPEIVSRLSGGAVRWDPLVMDSRSASLTNVVKQGDGVYPAPGDALASFSIELGVPYDNVFVYWLDRDPKNPSGPRLPTSQNWGMGPAGAPAARGAGYATISYKPPGEWTRDSETTETFVHEWLHQLEQYYEGAVALPMPKPGDASYLHSAEGHGYARAAGGGDLGYWKAWYRDFLQARVSTQGGGGLGSAAWGLGTIKDHRVVPVALPNPGQEYPNSQWRAASWRNQPGAMITETGGALADNGCTLLKSDVPDDIRASTTVAISPNTNYVFSAWVKTENVAIGEAGGSYGANLSLWGQPEASRSLTGTNGWTWVSVPFQSGPRTSVELCLRLGHHGSTASGRAWFDQVRLVAIR